MLNSLRTLESFFFLALLKRAQGLPGGWGGRTARHWNRKEMYTPKTVFFAIQPHTYQASCLCVLASDWAALGEEKARYSSTAGMFSSPFALTKLQTGVTSEHCYEGRSFHLGYWCSTLCISTLAKQPPEIVIPYEYLIFYWTLCAVREHFYL